MKAALVDLIEEARHLSSLGRPILIGTRTIKISEKISESLDANDVQHTLLNAKNDKSEAEIISMAGQAGRITIATNMAGRGTDIKLDPVAEAAGGLHVVVFGIHNSARIDRQLVGRCARQGDPGSFRKVVFLDDDLLEFAWGPPEAEAARKKLSASFHQTACLKLFQSAQASITSRLESSRAAMLHQEKKSIKQLSNAGFDPVLDIPS